MGHAFGHKFILVNDIRTPLDVMTFRGGPWVHLATVKRGLKEYVAIQHATTGKVYVEEVDEKEPGLFKRIKEDAEWADVYRFLKAAGIFAVDSEKKIAT